MQQASEVAIVSLHCGGEGLWWTLWHVAAAMDGPGVLWWPLWHVAAAIGGPGVMWCYGGGWSAQFPCTLEGL